MKYRMGGRLLFSYLGLAYLATTSVIAAECSIDSNNLGRGERKPFVICGEQMSPNYTIRGLSEANISVEYQQHLKRCGIGDNRKGLYLWLNGEDDAESATLRIFDTVDDSLLCDPIHIEIAEKVHVATASLVRSDDANSSIHLLEIVGDESQDLSNACAGGLTFPKWGRWPSRWPTLSQVTDEQMSEVPKSFRDIKQPLTCEPSSIRALVKVQGQQRNAAKIGISNVIVESGQEMEGVAYATLPDPIWASSMKDEDAKYININGYRTRYFDKGKSDDALILVHGGQPSLTGNNAQVWQQNFDALSRHFHVYAYDKIGQGYTDNPRTDEEWLDYYQLVVDQLWGFIEALDLERVHLVGQSQGSWPVTRVALDHPDRIKCLVNQDGLMAPTDPSGRAIQFFIYTGSLHPDDGPTIKSILLGKEAANTSLHNVFESKAAKQLEIARLPKTIEAARQMAAHQMSPRHPSFAALKQEAVEDIEAGKLIVPNLVLWGYNDPLEPYEVGVDLFKMISAVTAETQLHIFNDNGHSPYIEHPEEFNRQIVSFCGRYTSDPVN